ncbi:MAG TPA: ATP synthase F1 subunit epsilon [Patescibacteria group bacterium]|nr:ATP synthase F1 subunit epsilon [Patescibacteria group bacterium]
MFRLFYKIFSTPKTVLPHHAPLISSLKSGEAIIRKGGEEFSIAVSGGFLQVQPKNKVVVLADTAERAEEISEERAEEARKRAEDIIKEKRLDKAEMATAAAALEKSLIRLKVARRRSKRH